MGPLGIDLHRVPENQTSKINTGEGAGFPQHSAQAQTQSGWVTPQKPHNRPQWLKPGLDADSGHTTSLLKMADHLLKQLKCTSEGPSCI